MANLTPKQQRFYVYVIAIAGRVAYVGKGCGKRMETHLKSSHNLALRAMISAARRRGDAVRAKKIASHLPEHEALRIERTLICRNHTRLTNASLGSTPNHLKTAYQCEDTLSRIMPKDKFLATPCPLGFDQKKREGYYDKIVASLKDTLSLTRSHSHWFGPNGSMVIEVHQNG